mmetsp:Transcript_90991/g.180923  ORF Transcript_90991/g.180923 Transcript_90991/m.180923 type:complete len:319 (-) Transcript_90991:184-1140(-)
MAAVTGGSWSVSATIVLSVASQSCAPLLQQVVMTNSVIPKTSLVFAEQLVYLIGGFVLSGFECIRPAAYVAFLPAAVCFVITNIFTLQAVNALGAPQFALLNQLCLIGTALLQRALCGRRRTPLEWLALCQLVLAMCVFMHLNQPEEDNSGTTKPQAPDAAPRDLMKGLLYMAVVVPMSSIATVLMESQLKRSPATPFAAQMHQLSFFQAVFAFSFAAYEGFGLTVTNWSTLAGVLVVVCGARGSLSGLTVKVLDAVFNQIVCLFSILISYFVSVFGFGEIFKPVVLVQMMVIIMSVLLFVLAPKDPVGDGSAEKKYE